MKACILNSKNYTNPKWCLSSLVNDIKKFAAPVRSITYTDLLYANNGVYVFLYGDQIIYVGKCSSRSFSERMAAHISESPHGYMNNVMKAIAWSFSKKDKSAFLDDTNEPERTKCFVKAVRVMMKCKIAFISFDVTSSNPKDIGDLENKLIQDLDPVINNIGRKRKASNSIKFPW